MEQSNFFRLVHDGNQLSYKMMSLFLKHFDHKLSISQVILLEYIKQHGDAKPSDIAKALGFTYGAITTMTNKLVEMEYIVRISHTDDRRIVMLGITEAGLTLLKEAENLGERVRNAVYGILSDDELQQMKQIQDKLIQHVESIETL
ncbi:MarR family winged helix-turn-helix transcriptional regulator [Macrococcus armenti]|uniref:MarR family winged helix-turn-helix transcriptional regulator n=1 Tax=Macrococcus armenti TaxID=2875764 RepID=UPI001CCFDF82|nr:MarR family transcriptional regulator [Macrococcus armenti]UBH13170.1 MarR family transcriptional regulator [Macrococcus armenti]